MTVLNNLTALYNDPAAIAAMGIAHKVTMIPMYISMGVGQGVMPLIGYNFASGNAERMRRGFRFAARISLAFQSVMTLLLFLFPAFVIRLFMDDPLVVTHGARFLQGFALAQPFLCLDFLAVGVFQSCGMGGTSLLFAVLRKVALEIPALLVLEHFFPLYGLAYAQLCAEVVLAVAAAVTINRLFRRLERQKKLR